MPTRTWHLRATTLPLRISPAKCLFHVLLNC